MRRGRDSGSVGCRAAARMRGVPRPAGETPRVDESDRPCGPLRHLRSVRVAVVGSGFAGSLLARILAVQGHEVVLLERGSHPRFAIGESSTPLANLSLERIARRYGLDDCYQLAAHGRWVARFPELRRGLKRGFTFYRHHPGWPFHVDGTGTEIGGTPHAKENRHGRDERSENEQGRSGC